MSKVGRLIQTIFRMFLGIVVTGASMFIADFVRGSTSSLLSSSNTFEYIVGIQLLLLVLYIIGSGFEKLVDVFCDKNVSINENCQTILKDKI